MNDEVGIWRSTDLGQTWTRVAQHDIGHSCLPITTYHDRVYVHGKAGLLVSCDAGQTFVRIDGAPAFSHPLCLGEDDTRLMGFNAEGGWLSTDRGATWQRVLPPPPPLPTGAKLVQDHETYDYAWDFRRGIVYAWGSDVLWRWAMPGG